jgi:1-acyl-sn-glycerol-3-phosphate acyltransferase
VQKCSLGILVPVSINNSWKIVKYGFPLGLKSLTFVVHKPLRISSDFADLIEKQKQQ